MKENKETVMTADQYVVAELLKVKEELEEARKNVTNLTQANTYLTIENVKLESNLKEIRHFYMLKEGTGGNIYIQSKDADGGFGSIFAWESDANFQDLLKLFDLEKDYKEIKGTTKENNNENVNI